MIEFYKQPKPYSIANGNDDWRFEHLIHSENCPMNRYYYMAFCILDDHEAFGIGGNFMNHDGSLSRDMIRGIANFLISQHIDRITDAMDQKEKIAEFAEDFIWRGRNKTSFIKKYGKKLY